MPQKLPGGSHTAVGYWGNNPRCRIDQEAIGDKIKAVSGTWVPPWAEENADDNK